MDRQTVNNQINTRITRRLRTLGDETRFQIISLLLESDLCVGALARLLNITKPAVSQHLKILREAGLIRGEKRGYWTHYEVEKEALRETARCLQGIIEAPGNYAGDSAFICLRKRGSETVTEGRVLQMCKNCCEQPDKLKTKPEECSPEQVKECHGDVKEHPCECEKEE